ncbi:MAG: PAS domain-containing protein [Clostridiales bacterium]|nr:PAS domain-containing protein [Clostridiales bacterium]
MAGQDREQASVFWDTLMKIVPGGMIGFRLADEAVLFASDSLFELAGTDRAEAEAAGLLDWFTHIIHPDDQRRVRERIREQLYINGRAELLYRLLHRDGHQIWVRQYSGIIDSDHYGKYCLCLLLDHTDTKNALDIVRQTQEETKTLINTIPGGVAKLSASDDFRILMASDGYYRMTGYSEEECRRAPIEGRASRFVVPEDMPALIQAAAGLIQDNIPVCAEYRIRKKDGTLAWNTAYCSRVEREGDELILNGVFIDTTEAKSTERRLVSLINSIPGGVTRLHMDGDIRIDYANDGFYRLIGYTPQEFGREPVAGVYSRVIHPDDRQMVRERVRRFIDTDRVCPSLDYRIVTKTGSIRWMRASASRISDELEEQRSIQCVVYDITEEKLLQKQVELSEERYRIITEQTQDVVFDWNIETDSLYYPPVFAQKFGYTIPVECGTSYLLSSDIIHPDDRHFVADSVAALRGGQPYLETEYRIRRADGVYLWCRARITSIFDENHRPIRAIGILTDVDAYKREAASLQALAQKDSLTGLLNRMTIQKRIQDRLQSSTDGQQHALILMDIDHFKRLNDSLGHSAGDSLLIDLSARIQKESRKSDMAARMGGDEFAVFVDGVVSTDDALLAAGRLLALFRQTMINDRGEQCITGSLGVAVYPQHGRTFEALYEHADAALYISKRRGRDCSTLYDSRDTV